MLTTPYLIPDDSMLRALRSAAARGVRVDLVVPERAASFRVRHASRSFFADLLRAGVRIHLFTGGLLHTKSVTVDGEVAQTLTFTVTTNNTGLLSTPPALAANGTLTFTPAANANGSALITVELQDDGGTANGGVDITPPQEFTITVTAINDPPEWTVPGSQTAGQEADLTISGISLADEDAGGNELVVTLAALSGTLTLNDITNLTFGPGDGTRVSGTTHASHCLHVDGQVARSSSFSVKIGIPFHHPLVTERPSLPEYSPVFSTGPSVGLRIDFGKNARPSTTAG